MAPAVSFGSQEFLALPKGQQNELIFSLLAPLARYRVVLWPSKGLTFSLLVSLSMQVGSLAEFKGQHIEFLFSLLASPATSQEGSQPYPKAKSQQPDL
jgi:hypothetical protein